MVDPSDSEYQQTKAIKLGESQIPPPFAALAEWIAGRYGTVVLNVIYDQIPPHDRPRLQVILESQKDSQSFRHPNGVTFDEAKQQEITTAFRQLAAPAEHPDDRRRLLVTFSDFERVARAEANQKVSPDDLERLIAELGDQRLWKVTRHGDQVTFFFFTDAQAKLAVEQGLQEQYGLAYSRLLVAHDEFGYFRNRSVSVQFDSKETFETKFQGNQFLYDR